MKLTLAICDDSIGYINTLEDYIDKTGADASCDAFQSGEELLYAYENNGARYDAILLDMEMKALDGIQTANRIRKIDRNVIIVFITSYTKYMHRSFECEPFRFLVKPVAPEDIARLFSEMQAKLSRERRALVFAEGRNMFRLFCDDIIYFESQSHIVWVHTTDGSYKITKPISKVCEGLDSEMFFRIHRSYVVNLSFVKEIRESETVLYGCAEPILISRTRKRAFVSAFINFKERKYMI